MFMPLPEKFVQLSRLLEETQSLWKPVAFHQSSYAWLDEHSELTAKLLALRPAQIEHLHNRPLAIAKLLENHIPQAHAIEMLIELPKAHSSVLPNVNPRFHAGIPGRKWQQVKALCASMSDTLTPVLEYCAGKSHLGFYVEQRFAIDVVALEWQQSLVAQANDRAQRENRRLHSYQVDVMSDACDSFFQGRQQVLALHACGALHERLIALCIEHQIPQLHLAPCCYHKRQDNIYKPYSKIAKASDLVLTKDDLHTAVMETVTAGATQISQRKKLQIMRLGFDLLQREVLGSDTFLPVPSLALSWSRVSFEDFCRHCATVKDIVLPARIDWQHYWQLAQLRFHEVSALDLMRALFRRPLEIWLNMDKALWLQEHQYEVILSTFCDRQTSPRNILLQAKR